MTRYLPSPFVSVAALALFLNVTGINLWAKSVDGLSLPSKSITIGSPVQEILAEVLVEEGDEVEKDQVLARLVDDKEQIESRRYQKVLEKREFDYNASKNLQAQNILSREKALAAEAELELAKVDAELAAAQLKEKTIRSTADGIVIRRFAEPGEFVDRVQPLFEIVNIDELILQFYLSPELLTFITPGDKVPFRMTNQPDQTGEAIVDFISPSADPRSGLFRVKLLAKNPDHQLLAGVRVTAEFLEE